MSDHDAQPGNTPPETDILLTVIYDSGMDERLTEVLDSLSLDGWTKTFGGHGFGGAGRKEDTPIWPGTVNTLLIVLPETHLETALSALRALKSSYRRNPGMTLWTHPVTRR